MCDQCGVMHSMLRTRALMTMRYVKFCVSCGKSSGFVIARSSSDHCFVHKGKRYLPSTPRNEHI